MRKVALLFLAFVPAFIFGAVTIPAGAEVIIDENNLSDYSQGIVFADNSAVVCFNLQSAPSMPIAGGGTIVKVSDADWTMTTSIPDFTGDYILAGSGVVSAGIVEAFGDRGDRWKQVVGGGPELGYGAGYKKKDSACPTIIEGVVENGHLQVRVHDAWRGGIVSERRFKAR